MTMATASVTKSLQVILCKL